ncbi:MAG TPA: hypothetical protein VFB50_04230, partial [Chloroflexota bacterium]|nr:hypothetical protein [Chloroflexota bacterium]
RHVRLHAGRHPTLKEECSMAAAPNWDSTPRGSSGGMPTNWDAVAVPGWDMGRRGTPTSNPSTRVPPWETTPRGTSTVRPSGPGAGQAPTDPSVRVSGPQLTDPSTRVSGR